MSEKLSVNGLSKSIHTANGRLDILKDINFSINSSESVAIIGASGSGKSTLLSLLAGLDTASAGSILLDGEDISLLNEEQRAFLRQQKIGFIFQSFHLITSLSALDNVMLPLELKHDKQAHKKAMSLLDRVGLNERYDHLPLQLSGGEQQRVAIARAFAADPEILFADEPTGNLDQKSGDNIIQLLFDLNKEQGTTLVLVTHDMQLASVCQRFFHLDFGELTELDSLEHA
ncbi:MAG: ABC transporter ATP-binding protein [Proteobacteria bacterium]|nr:ABC transporter ATP-binding protein [Pseudomonadota bacterium]